MLDMVRPLTKDEEAEVAILEASEVARAARIGRYNALPLDAQVSDQRMLRHLDDQAQVERLRRLRWRRRWAQILVQRPVDGEAGGAR